MIRAVLLDFYGTLAYEDDGIVAEICGQVASACVRLLPLATWRPRWSELFAGYCASSIGDDFESQRAIVRRSLGDVGRQFGCSQELGEWTRKQFGFWRQPPLFEDAREFLNRLASGVRRVKY